MNIIVSTTLYIQTELCNYIILNVTEIVMFLCTFPFIHHDTQSNIDRYYYFPDNNKYLSESSDLKVESRILTGLTKSNQFDSKSLLSLSEKLRLD